MPQFRLSQLMHSTGYFTKLRDNKNITELTNKENWVLLMIRIQNIQSNQLKVWYSFDENYYWDNVTKRASRTLSDINYNLCCNELSWIIGKALLNR